MLALSLAVCCYHPLVAEPDGALELGTHGLPRAAWCAHGSKPSVSQLDSRERRIVWLSSWQ